MLRSDFTLMAATIGKLQKLVDQINAATVDGELEAIVWLHLVAF